MIEHKKLMHIAEMRKLERQIKSFEIQERETFLLMMKLNELEDIERTFEKEKWRRERCLCAIDEYERTRVELIRLLEFYIERYPDRKCRKYTKLINNLPQSFLRQCI